MILIWVELMRETLIYIIIFVLIIAYGGVTVASGLTLKVLTPVPAFLPKIYKNSCKLLNYKDEKFKSLERDINSYGCHANHNGFVEVF